MIILAVDPSSESFAQGQAIGTLLVAVLAAALVWRLTRSWRQEAPGRGPAPSSPAPLAEAAEADARVTDGGADGSWARARRRQRIVLGVVAAIVALGVTRALSFEGEPPAARSGAGSAAVAGAGQGEAVPDRVVEGPERVGEYRLLAGEDPMKGKKRPRGRQWYYDRDGDGAPDLMLGIDAVEWDPSLAAEKGRDTLDQELRNFFAGAKAQDVTPFDAGPWGGKLSCGTLAASGAQPVLCAWTDSGTFGSVLLGGGGGDLAGAAKTALAFRTAAEKRG
ncbi:hypothetical protein GCM10010222_00060 [Streptomyces tanashiensis]|uniref:hypothetical protein n=1 Tax=Streptomyces tanashiensis TaxID=67367 RepID=UPI0016794950|nr:hypothetical protein [Streptomyces tanashiensis]GGS63889.1 hypothetical protein GCM10010222_00060 [Streptomyces tanashiensis]